MPKTKTASHTSQKVILEVRAAPTVTPAYKFIDRRGGAPASQRDYTLTKTQQALCGVEAMGSRDGYDEPENQPEEITDALELSRLWHRKNLFIQGIASLKIALAIHRCQIKPSGALRTGPGASSAEREQFRKWLTFERQQRIKRFIRETLEDYVIMDNAVAFWRTTPFGQDARRDGRTGDRARAPVTERVLSLKPEMCKYSDAMAIEKLKVRLGWTREELSASRTDGPIGQPILARDLARYAQREIELDPARGERFRVLKRDRVGWGFAWPRVFSVFRTLAQNESHEISDNLWAFLSRAVIRQFKVGHETRYGPKAGSNAWFWTKTRGNAIREFFEGRVGILDFTGNFDINIEFPFPSLDRFERKKYESVWQRLALWAGPVGLMLVSSVAKGAPPPEFLLRLMEAEIEELRDDVAMHCTPVITEVFRPPVPIRLAFSNKLFTDHRQFIEMLKHLLAAGPLSQRTALEAVSLDTEEERENKTEEAALLADEKTKGQVLPVFDPAHGKRPGNEPPGRPAGAKDSGQRAAQGL